MQHVDRVEQAGASQPIVLSTVPLPTRPANNGNVPSLPKGARYRHVLGPRAINPCKDLVALVSRDVAPTPAAGAAGPGATDPHAGLPPPPPGMSAAAAQALMRMRMIARAKALAQQKGPGGSAPGEASAATSTTSAPKLTKCAPLRLSLWRMSSVAGELGERVWDLAITIPDLFHENKESDDPEVEDMAVDDLSWSPDGQMLALSVRAVRRSVRASRSRRFITLHALQDGKQISTTPLPQSEAEGMDNEAMSHMRWEKVNRAKPNVASGSASHLLSVLDPLPSALDNKEQNSQQRQKALHRPRDPRPQHLEKKVADIVASDPRGQGENFLFYPTTVGSISKADTQVEEGTSATMLYIGDSKGIHALLDASIYLGRILVDTNIVGIHASSSHKENGEIVIAGCTEARDSLKVQSIAPLLPGSTQCGDALFLLRDLSSASCNLNNYVHDTLMAIRDAYRTMHVEGIADWNRRARSIAKQYATHYPTELMMLLMTGHANDGMMAALLGNDAASENDLRNMRAGIASKIARLETMTTGLVHAARRLVLIFEEIRGYHRWPEKFGALLSTPASPEGAGVEPGASLDDILAKLKQFTVQCYQLLTLLAREQVAWHDFYVWWMYERLRQEAYRDDKPAPEPPDDLAYNVVVLSSFFQRGFDNYAIEQLIGVSMDARTRGNELDDDDDEDGNSDGGEDEKASRAGETGASQKNESNASLGGWHAASGEDKGDQSTEGVMRSNAAGDSAMSEKQQPWYESTALARAFARSKEALRRPPDAKQTDDDFVRVPSEADVGLIASAPVLYAGPAEGAARRRELFGSRPCTLSLVDVFFGWLSLASPLLRGAFQQWTAARPPSTSDGITSRVEISLQGAVAATQASGVYSEAANPFSGEVKHAQKPPAAQLVRMHVAREARRCMVACITLDNAAPAEDGDMVILQVSTCALSSANAYEAHSAMPLPATTEARVWLGHSDEVRVRDVQFYSASEILILLHSAQDASANANANAALVPGAMPTTTLLSLHVGDMLFVEADTADGIASAAPPPPSRIRPFRSLVLASDDIGAGATMLACNHAKDVCATLNDGDQDDAETCQLVYWDMVMLPEGDHETDAIVDEDHDMGAAAAP